MDNWNPDYNKPNTEQRSSSIDPEFFNAETQRVATGLNPGGDLQSSDIGWSPTSRKQENTKGFNESDLLHRNVDQKEPTTNTISNPTSVQPLKDTSSPQTVPDSSSPTFNDSYVPPYKKEKHRGSVPHEEDILFFGDSNTTETKNYPSRSLLDQENLHRGSISTLPSAGERRRRSSAISGNKPQSPPFRRRSSNLSGAGDFLPRQEAQSTLARDDVPIGSAAFSNENDRISALPMDADQYPSTHEPAGFSLQDTYKQKTSDSARSQPLGHEEDSKASNQVSNEASDKQQEKSYKDMATGAVASVAATATAAAAAIFGAHSDEDETTQQDRSMRLPPKIQEEDSTEAATQSQQGDSGEPAAQLQDTSSDAAIQARRDSSFEPAIQGQDACYDTTDKICNEHMPDEKHAFCDCVKEPVIHGQQPCYLCCKDTEDSQVKPSSSPFGTATIFGTSGAGVGYLGTTAATDAPEDTKASSALAGVEDNTLASNEDTGGLNKPLVDEHLVNEGIDEGFSSAHDVNKGNGADRFENIENASNDKDQESSATPGLDTKHFVGGVAGGATGGAALSSVLHKSDDKSRVSGTKQQTDLYGLNKQQGPNELNTTEPPLYNETTGYNSSRDNQYNQTKQYDSSQEIDPLQNVYGNNQSSQQDNDLGETDYIQSEGYPESQPKEYEQSDVNTTDAVYNEPIIKHSELNKNLTSDTANPPSDSGFAAAAIAPNTSLDTSRHDETFDSTYPPSDSLTSDKQKSQFTADNAATTSPNDNTTAQDLSKDSTLPQQNTDRVAMGTTNSTISPTTAGDNTSSQKGATTTGPVTNVNAASTTVSGEEHAFGGENAFGNRESVHRTSNVVPSEQNHGVISDDNDTKKKSRKGSIKKVFEKIFHK